MMHDAEEPRDAQAETAKGGLRAQEYPQAHGDEPEALFTVAEIRALQLASEDCSPGVSDFLAHQVARDPADLRRHVQRISLFIRRGDGSGAYGAMVDLFIALGESGLALRRRMLAMVKPMLSSDQHSALERKLKTGLSALDQVPLSRESVLGKGIRGTTKLVEREVMSGEAGQDLLEEAHSRLEHGQVDEARRVLEEAILKDPRREDVQKELLEIYRRLADRTHFSSMLEALQFSGIPIPPDWQQLATDLGLDDT